MAASSSSWKVGPLSLLSGGGEGAGGTASARDAESIDGCRLPTLLAAAEADWALGEVALCGVGVAATKLPREAPEPSSSSAASRVTLPFALPVRLTDASLCPRSLAPACLCCTLACCCCWLPSNSFPCALYCLTVTAATCLGCLLACVPAAAFFFFRLSFLCRASSMAAVIFSSSPLSQRSKKKLGSEYDTAQRLPVMASSTDRLGGGTANERARPIDEGTASEENSDGCESTGRTKDGADD